MSTSGKGKGPFGSVWPTPENVTGKDLDPRAAGDSANEAALKDFFFGASATTHAGGAASFAGAQSTLTASAPAVIRKGGAVFFAGAQSTLTASAGTLVSAGPPVRRWVGRGFSSRRPRRRRR